jgi:glycosyltransferase involved in cell wall biosynthesis
MMPTPRFSIVIPTRQRPHTLEHTLATCLAQEGPEFEIVVSDNFSSPRTRELVERRADSRVRYVRTPAPLAMTDSLEFAVGHARGEFVVIQGDDDGLLRHALPVIDAILHATNTALLRWDSAVYNWPDVSNPHFSPNTLLLPLTQTRRGHALCECDSRKMIRAAANGHVSYSELPVIYNTAIRRDLLDQLRARTGRVFKTRTPDVYIAFALAALVEKYHSLRAPLGICGRSGASTGVARHFCKKGSPIDNDFRRLNAAAGLDLHPWVPDLPPIPSAVADAFLWAKRELFPDDGRMNLDRQLLIRNCLRDTEIDTADEWREVQDGCRQSLADSPELLEWFDREYGSLDFTTLPRPNRSHHWKHYGQGYLHLNTNEFGVGHIDAAAELCERLLGYRRDGLLFQVESFEGVGDSLSELQQKEAEIQQKDGAIRHLHEMCDALQRQLREQHVAFTAALEDRQRRLQFQEQASDERQARIDALTAKRDLPRGWRALIGRVFSRRTAS